MFTFVFLLSLGLNIIKFVREQGLLGDVETLGRATLLLLRLLLLLVVMGLLVGSALLDDPSIVAAGHDLLAEPGNFHALASLGDRLADSHSLTSHVLGLRLAMLGTLAVLEVRTRVVMSVLPRVMVRVVVSVVAGMVVVETHAAVLGLMTLPVVVRVVVEFRGAAVLWWILRPLGVHALSVVMLPISVSVGVVHMLGVLVVVHVRGRIVRKIGWRRAKGPRLFKLRVHQVLLKVHSAGLLAA